MGIGIEDRLQKPAFGIEPGERRFGDGCHDLFLDGVGCRPLFATISGAPDCGKADTISG
jgi:hypothetical protein